MSRILRPHYFMQRSYGVDHVEGQPPKITFYVCSEGKVVDTHELEDDAIKHVEKLNVEYQKKNPWLGKLEVLRTS